MTETTEQSRKCSNCMWWADHSDRGECRGAPPIIFADDRSGRWPTTYAYQWCGSFRMKEPGQ